MKKNDLKSLIKDQGFVLLNDWQENNLKGGTAAADNCSCTHVPNNCTCSEDNCGCPPAPTPNNCTCGSGEQNTACPDNCNCFITQNPPAPSDGPTKLKSVSTSSFWPGMM